MLKKYILVVLVISSVISCTTGSVNIKSDYSFNKQENVGLVIGSATKSSTEGKKLYGNKPIYSIYNSKERYAGSISTEKPNIDKAAGHHVADTGLTILANASLAIITLGLVRGGDIDTFDSKLKVNKADSSNTGYMFVMKMPPGEYQIKRWSVSQGPSREEGLTPQKFDVVKGQVTYIGNLHMNLLRTSYAHFGPSRTKVDEAFPEIRDQYKRDISLFIKYFKNLGNVTIRKQLLRLGPWT